MICIIELFNEIEIFGVEIDRETQVDMVIETLPNSFKQFKLNYFMNKLMMSLTKLLRERKMTQGILKDQRGIHMKIKGSLGSSSHKIKK